MSRQIHATKQDGQRARRTQFRLDGRCPTCGAIRDRQPFLTCARCAEAVIRSKARQGGYQAETLPVRSAGLAVHPRWPSPLRGTVALGLFMGFRRKVA